MPSSTNTSKEHFILLTGATIILNSEILLSKCLKKAGVAIEKITPSSLLKTNHKGSMASKHLSAIRVTRHSTTHCSRTATAHVAFDTIYCIVQLYLFKGSVLELTQLPVLPTDFFGLNSNSHEYLFGCNFISGSQ